MLYRVTLYKDNAVIFLLAVLFLPGVVIHELAHYLTATLLLVKTGEIEFMPQVRGGSVKLGSVQIAHTDPIRRFFIGIAPLVVGVFIILGVVSYFSTAKLPLHYALVLFIEAFIIFEIGNTMFSSKRDLEGAVELLGVVAILCITFYIAGFRIPTSVIDFLNSTQVTTSLSHTATALLIPIGIDVLLIVLGKFIPFLFSRR